MDLDPMKRRLVTRAIGISDMVIGTCVLVFNLHTMWEYYLYDVNKSKVPNIYNVQYNISSDEDDDLDNTAERLIELKLPYYSIIMLCILVFAVNIFQIFMGFAILIATFGRNQCASINIAQCWIRTSLTLLFLIVLKVILMIAGLLAKPKFADWSTFGIGVFEFLFRIFSLYWIPKFIIFLERQSEFDARCHVIRY